MQRVVANITPSGTFKSKVCEDVMLARLIPGIVGGVQAAFMLLEPYLPYTLPFALPSLTQVSFVL